MFKINLKNKGFTLVELMVTVGIFTIISGLLLARYSNFNQGIILTNLAYDIALTIRSA
jgi:prepilin-type N-terminal cleavage/methylation domain-containing protein